VPSTAIEEYDTSVPSSLRLDLAQREKWIQTIRLERVTKTIEDLNLRYFHIVEKKCSRHQILVFFSTTVNQSFSRNALGKCQPKGVGGGHV